MDSRFRGNDGAVEGGNDGEEGGNGGGTSADMAVEKAGMTGF